MNKAFSFACKSFWYAAITLLLAPPAPAQTAKVSLDRVVVQTATITDVFEIELFIEDLMIVEKQITELMLFDLNGDGFGEGDVARTFPSGGIYFLAPGKKARELMKTWSKNGNVKLIPEPRGLPERFESAPDSVRTPPLENSRPRKTKTR